MYFFNKTDNLFYTLAGVRFARRFGQVFRASHQRGLVGKTFCGNVSELFANRVALQCKRNFRYEKLRSAPKSRLNFGRRISLTNSFKREIVILQRFPESFHF